MEGRRDIIPSQRIRTYTATRTTACLRPWQRCCCHRRPRPSQRGRRMRKDVWALSYLLPEHPIGPSKPDNSRACKGHPLSPLSREEGSPGRHPRTGKPSVIQEVCDLICLIEDAVGTSCLFRFHLSHETEHLHSLS